MQSVHLYFSVLCTLSLSALALAESSSVDPTDAPLWQSACRNEDDGSYSIQPGRLSYCVTWGYLQDVFNQTGWSQLRIDSNPQFDDLTQAYAAGYLEGAISQVGIFRTRQNFFDLAYVDSSPPAVLYEFIGNNSMWIRDELNRRNIPSTCFDGVINSSWTPNSDAAGRESDPSQLENISSMTVAEEKYWMAVATMYFQLRGLFDGYTSVAPADQALTWYDIYLINDSADADDLMAMFGPQPSLISSLASTSSFSSASSSPSSSSVHRSHHAKRQLQQHAMMKQPKTPVGGGHCSALMKLTDDFSDLFVSHVTWYSYSSCLRTWKLYRLEYSFAENKEIQFSSYPGFLWSSDDFYTLREQQMSVHETSITAINVSVFSGKVNTSGQLPCWVRAQLANRLATDGKKWGEEFAKHNSGTYNNDWQVVDFKRFTPGQRPSKGDGLLHIVGQIPGNVQTHDMTHILVDQSYWGSYNIPVYPDHFDAMGYSSYAKQFPDYFSYTNCTRANIFRRESTNIKTIADMQRVMRLNQWKTDPLSLGGAGNAIAARWDLDVLPDPVPALGWFVASGSGAIDAKITAASLMAPQQTNGQPCCASVISSGPTHDDQVPFSFSADSRWSSMSRLGLPDTLAFGWMTMNLADDSQRS